MLKAIRETRTAEALRARLRDRPPAPPAPERGVLRPAVRVDSIRHAAGHTPAAAQVASRRLLERLGADGREAVAGTLTPDQRAALDAAGPADRDRMTLAYGVHHRVPAVLDRTGLRADTPPEGIHAMARGELAAGGDHYYADLVAGAFAEAELPLADGHRALDFGCSSGRVVRALAAALPEVEWHGCDPLADAIAWAGDHLPGIEFSVSPQRPPLDHPGAHFDAIFAISIWSHFDQAAAVAWLKEMHRLVRPGGGLLLTTHGLTSVGLHGRVGARVDWQLEEIVAALCERGFWFANEFGPSGDSGLVDPEWGSTFLLPEWLLRQATPAWSLALFEPGCVEGNQDLYVLVRR